MSTPKENLYRQQRDRAVRALTELNRAAKSRIDMDAAEVESATRHALLDLDEIQEQWDEIPQDTRPATEDEHDSAFPPNPIRDNNRTATSRVERHPVLRVIEALETAAQDRAGSGVQHQEAIVEALRSVANILRTTP